MQHPLFPAGGAYGTRIIGLQDVNGDGYGDFAIFATRGLESNDSRFGRIFVYSGAACETLYILAGDPSHTSERTFAHSFATLGDVDGDLVNDILVGEIGFNATGYAYVFSGRTGSQRFIVTDSRPGFEGNYGGLVSRIPDVDDDGVSDFAVGAPLDGIPARSGIAYLYSGATGERRGTILPPEPMVNGIFAVIFTIPDVDGDENEDILASAALPSIPGAMTSGTSYFLSGASHQVIAAFGFNTGMQVASVPDLDGDGVVDLVFGNPSGETDGIVYVLSGATRELIYGVMSPTSPRYTSQFGSAVAGLPDIDGDDRGDFLVGAFSEGADGFPRREGPGAAYLVSGSTGFILRRLDSTSPIRNGSFGAAVAVVPDCNGDGIPEFLVTASNERRVYLFLSCAADFDRSGTLSSHDFFAFLDAFFNLAPAADLNHDGFINSQDFFDYLTAFFAGCP